MFDLKNDNANGRCPAALQALGDGVRWVVQFPGNLLNEFLCFLPDIGMVAKGTGNRRGEKS